MLLTNPIAIADGRARSNSAEWGLVKRYQESEPAFISVNVIFLLGVSELNRPHMTIFFSEQLI